MAKTTGLNAHHKKIGVEQPLGGAKPYSLRRERLRAGSGRSLLRADVTPTLSHAGSSRSPRSVSGRSMENPGVGEARLLGGLATGFSVLS